MQQPDLSENEIEAILAEAEDYQIAKGSLLKLPRSISDLDSPVAFARPIGVSLRPTPFPREHFTTALAIQEVYNELYMKIVEEQTWLEGIVVELAKTDVFAQKLWSIWEGIKSEGEVQPLHCGIFRSDYMLHKNDSAITENTPCIADEAALKQVEFNTFSCAGAAHANIVADMYRYLTGKGLFERSGLQPTQLPRNHCVKSIVRFLEKAHRAYCERKTNAKLAVILMTVQPNNVNICDERPIEYGLSECYPPVTLYRVEFSNEVMQRCSLGPHRELLFQPASGVDPVEVSVVYQRAGYDSDEYNNQGINTRYMLERSRAIKCPPLLSHLSGFKKVQQELTKDGVLEQFVTPEKAALLRNTFMSIYPLDESKNGQFARELIRDKVKSEKYILKPSLEGGGHNVYGDDIPIFLDSMLPQEWSRFILMEKIIPPSIRGILVSSLLRHQGPVISELGVVGTCLWEQGSVDAGPEILENEVAGWTFKTKPADVDEISVIKGYGCFDCPLLDHSAEDMVA
ncbi:glutathione synthase [Xylariaceae sp. FL0016]|nr:glutathione synthase [Xylariaceae sp. FL0016]